MSWEPENKRSNGSYAADYSAEEAAVVDHAKKLHKETTASAQRALKVLCSLQFGCRAQVSAAGQFQTCADAPCTTMYRVGVQGCEPLPGLLHCELA